jgi:outer membrane protein OmpA-like peptidoglycan-associated protein
MFRLTITCSAVALAAMVAGGSRPSLAQGADAAMFGVGPDRICSALATRTGDAVLDRSATAAVRTEHTYDCPEVEMVAEVAVVEPAAPPPMPLPESGLVYFDFDKADLNTEAQATMEKVITDIKGRDLGGIIVGGHTDTAGPPDYNMQLSQRRANTVAAELVRSGIPATIVTTEAFGETDLAVQTGDNTPDQANRRATIDFER